jgi:hypothetical protein
MDKLIFFKLCTLAPETRMAFLSYNNLFSAMQKKVTGLLLF